jgi:two-component system vancomycin resistance associated response regulator VraR
MTRIVIADDHEATRHSLRSALTQDASWEVCGEACDGKEALQQVLELHPDLVILDYLMPHMNGLEAACEIRLNAPSTKIVVLSMIDTPQMEGATQLVGVDAFVSKSSNVTDLVAVLKQVLNAEENSPRYRFRRL